ncbi:MAG: hypothetical protein ACLGH4_01730, partial [Actinomycetes bacterium]
ASVSLPQYRPIPLQVSVVSVKDQRGESARATVTATVLTSDPAVPLTMTAAYDPAISSPPERCSATDTGATCDATAGGTYEFVVDVGRIRNQPRAGLLAFSVTVPESHYDDTPNYAEEVVERFGESDGGNGPTTSTTGGLQPSDTSSPVVETIEKATETFTKVAKSVTLAGKRPSEQRTSATTSRVTKPAKTVKDAAGHKVDRKPSGSRTTRPAGDTDRREAVRDERHSRAATHDKKSPAGAERGQKDSTDTTSPVADTTSEESTTGVVDAVAKGVKKIL